MNFHESKTIIREALSEASDAVIITLLADARAGKVRYISCRRCFCGHVYGLGWTQAARDWAATQGPNVTEGKHPYWTVSAAYRALAPDSYCFGDFEAQDARRQRVLVPIILAEIRRRTRAMAPVEAEAVTA